MLIKHSKHKGEIKMTTNKQRDQKKFWIRVLCIAIAFIMIASTIMAALGLF